MQRNESSKADTIFVQLLTAVRSGRRPLREHPSDLASILPNQLAAQGVDWSEIDSILRDGSGRPYLRFQRSFDEGGGAVTILPSRQITAAAVRSNHIVAGTADGELLSWPISDTRELAAGVAAHRGRVSMLAFVGSNELLLSGGADGAVQLWPATPTPGSNTTFSGHTSEITSAIMAGSDRVIAGARDGSIRVWDRDSSRELNTFVGHAGPITTLDASPDQSVLVSGATDCTLRVWDLNAGTLRALLRGHLGDITGGALVRSGETFRVLSASADGLLKLWNLDGNELATLGGHTGAVRALKLVTWLDTPLAISGGDDGTVWVWDVEKAGERRVFRGHRGPVTSVCAFGDEPGLVLSASDDGTCRLWDLVTGSLLKDYRIGGSPVTALSAAGAGDIAACVTGEGTLARIDLSAMAATEPARVHIALSQGGDRMFVGAGRHLRLQPIDGGPGAAAAKPDSFGEILDVAMNWTADCYVSLHEGGGVLYWSLEGQLIEACDVPRDTSAIAISPSGSLLVTGTSGGRLQAWRRASQFPPSRFSQVPLTLEPSLSLQATLEGPTPIHACGCDMSERRAVSAGADGTLRIWDLLTHATLFAIRAHDRDVLDCDIAHDGTFALSASADGTLKVWDLATGSLRVTLEGHRAEVTACRINRSADRADRAVSCSRDGSVKLWDLVQGRCLDTFYGEAPFVSMSMAPAAPTLAIADLMGKVWVLKQVDESGAEVTQAALRSSATTRRPGPVDRL